MGITFYLLDTSKDGFNFQNIVAFNNLFCPIFISGQFLQKKTFEKNEKEIRH